MVGTCYQLNYSPGLIASYSDHSNLYRYKHTQDSLKAVFRDVDGLVDPLVLLQVLESGSGGGVGVQEPEDELHQGYSEGGRERLQSGEAESRVRGWEGGGGGGGKRTSFPGQHWNEATATYM